MKERVKSLARVLVSPSMRFELKQAAAWLHEQIGRAALWRWEIARFPGQSDRSYDILFAGRRERRALALALVGVRDAIAPNPAHSHLHSSSRTVLVSEVPFPGSLCVPWYLRAVVRLGRPVEEVTASYGDKLIRLIRKRRPGYHTRQALDEAEIDRAEREMLQPYANARHGVGAIQLGQNVVGSMARKFGRLDLLFAGDEAVACHLGYTIIRGGKRHWSALRFGFPEAVFSDSKRLHEVNSINTYLALEWAIENGFDYYDIGPSLGSPDDGLLQWKRRRGGAMDLLGNHGYFHVRLPTSGAAQFLWDAPLFAVERGCLTLQLGVPVGPSDDEVLIRYREMGFEGLSSVALHCARPPGEPVKDMFRSLFAHLQSPPTIVVTHTA